MSAEKRPALWPSIALVTATLLLVSAVYLTSLLPLLPILVPVTWLVLVLPLVAWHYGMRYGYRKSGNGPGAIGRVVWRLPAILLSVLLIVPPAWESLPRNQFARYIVDPVPSSVRGIRVGGDEALLFEHKVIYFEIEPTDFAELLAGRDYVSGSIPELSEDAERHVGVTLGDLAPSEVYHLDLSTEQEKSAGTSCTQTIVTNEDHNRVLFFYNYDN